MLLLGTTVAHAGRDVFSVNFYAYQNITEEDQYENVTLEPDQSAGLGDWETTGWNNIEMPWHPAAPQYPVTITSNQGSTATFTLHDVRNGGASQTAHGIRTVPLGDGNGDLFDAGGWGSEDPKGESNILDVTGSDIPFATYDVIVYTSLHRGPGVGVITFNGTPTELNAVSFDGTFTEIVNSGDTGNYIVYENVKGSSFTVQLWGYGPNHVRVAGFQFREVNPAAGPSPADESTDVPRDVILGWSPGETAAAHDVYLGTVFDDVNDADRSDPRSVLARQGQIATTYDAGRLDFGQTYYWRIDEVNAPPDSTISKGDV